MPNLRSEDSDFELRTARTGGEIMLRDEWLQAATSTYRVRSFRIRDLSVRQLGNAAITNFLDEQVAVSGGQNLTGNFFIVDAGGHECLTQVEAQGVTEEGRDE